jgi:hypothetical protein
VEPYDDHMPANIAAQTPDSLAPNDAVILVERPMIDGTETTQEESQWKVIAGVLTYEGRIYVPVIDSLCGNVRSLFLDNPETGHFGALKTTALVCMEFYWLVMDLHVHRHVRGCEVCHRIKAPWHARHGINTPVETPSQPWKGVMTDFLTDLPDSTALGYTGILVIVVRLTKMGIYLPCWKDIESPELARHFFEHVICKRRVSDNIVTDHGTQFTTRFWTRVCSHMSTHHQLSAAIHPQTEGQMERQHQVMEQYLRAFCNYEQDNWVILLPLAKFDYNDLMLPSTTMTPFWANYHNHPVMQFRPPKQPSSLNSEIQEQNFAAGLEETDQTLHKNMQEAQASQRKYNDGNDVVSRLEIGSGFQRGTSGRQDRQSSSTTTEQHRTW